MNAVSQADRIRSSTHARTQAEIERLGGKVWCRSILSPANQIGRT